MMNEIVRSQSYRQGGKSMKHYLIGIFAFITFVELCYGQNQKADSLFAVNLFAKYEKNKDVKLNANGLKLSLNKKEVKEITEIILYKQFGRNKIRRERPFHFFKIEEYWIIWGTHANRREYGGVFEIIIDSRNGAVEHLSHGK